MKIINILKLKQNINKNYLMTELYLRIIINHKNLIIPYENHENYENHRIPNENNDNHEILEFHLRIKHFLESIEFLAKIIKHENPRILHHKQ